MSEPWDLAWRRLVAACAEARRRYAAAGGDRSGPAVEYPKIAPPVASPDRPASLRDDLAKLAPLSRAYFATHASGGAGAVTVALLVTSRGKSDLAFGANVLPEPPGPLPPGAIGPPIALEASRALLTAPIRRAGRFLPGDGGRLAFEPAAGLEQLADVRRGGEPADLPGLLLEAFRAAGPPEG